jgi:hypothetical protein
MVGGLLIITYVGVCRCRWISHCSTARIPRECMMEVCHPSDMMPADLSRITEKEGVLSSFLSERPKPPPPSSSQLTRRGPGTWWGLDCGRCRLFIHLAMAW